ncbi:M20 aminoacylase family protein [Enterovirga sp.]|uniref:M20 aminoacylase family protein n=1 Tax=Enterovirga sp. TaxID=2026350 RepID=UPI002C666500|nr:M20 aminoacylase family protein [Enterovirga sp.]HMO28191.1 M20 aminoacylase family protein [Enterovirga sp.]
MKPISRIAAYADELTALRRDFHAHPEIGFEETRTSGIVAEKLASWGVEVHRNVGKTGVVGIIQGNGRPGASIGLRADMDALPIEEATDVAWKSTRPGTMHACGHDGHTTMLLGAARYLAETRDFPGRVVCIFQPAEEGLGGARAMLADGLFERFPCQEVYGLHNTPAGPRYEVSVKSGPAMAAADFFDIHIKGKGSHGALPQQANDPTMIAVTLAQAMQTIVSRNVDPLRAAVVSITQIHAGAAYNVVPETAHLAGTVRCFDPEVRLLVRRRIEELARGVAAGFGAKAEVDYRDIFSVTMNGEVQTDAVLEVAHEIVGEDLTRIAGEPMMGSEDFADMLHQVPGAYFFLGMTPGASLHNAAYTFDDAILPVGASMLARLGERRTAALANTAA